MKPDVPFTEEQRDGARKIAKLLQLGHKNPNLEEAASALQKAQDLALALNLDIAAIGATADEGTRKQEKVRGGFYDHQVWVWQEVSELNFVLYFPDGGWNERKVRSWKNPDGSWNYRTERKWEKRHGLVGRQHNIVATKAMATYLEAAVERLVMERLGNDNRQRYSNWAVSFRKGAILDICGRLRERRQEIIRTEEAKAEEAAARAAAGAASTSTAMSLASFAQTETDANLDERHGWPPGTAARHRAERVAKQAARAAAQREAEAEYVRWAAAHPAEAAKMEAKRKAEEAKREAREARSGGSYWKNVDWSAFRGGESAGRKIGLDPQQDTGVGRGRGLGHG